MELADKSEGAGLVMNLSVFCGSLSHFLELLNGASGDGWLAKGANIGGPLFLMPVDGANLGGSPFMELLDCISITPYKKKRKKIVFNTSTYIFLICYI